MKVYSIYALVDPETKEVRYVGYSTNAQARYRQHLGYGRKESEKMCTGQWIASLLRRGLRPEMVILEEYAANTGIFPVIAEKQWIQHYLKNGSPLLNRHTRKPHCKASRVLPDRDSWIQKIDRYR